MADLDVAVRLKFLTAGDDKLKAAARDLQAFGKASGKLSTAATGRLGGDLTKAWTASVKLGGALDKSAGAASRTAAGLGRIGKEARDIDRARVAVEKLSKANITLGMSLAGARARAAGVGVSGGASGVIAGGAIGGAAASKRREARAAFLSEAASRVTPEGYLIGAGGAVAMGAAVGATAATGVGAAAIATKEAIGRNKSFAEIMKKVTLDTGESWDTLDRKIAHVSTTLGVSYEQAAAIFAQGGQGNVAYKDLEGFAMLGAKVATAWDIGAKEAAQMLTEVKAQTNWTIPQLQTFGDKVNFLGDISAAAEKDIGAMWQRASAGAKAAGVSYDDAMVAMTALRGVGMQDEVASRFFGQFSSKLRRASSLSKDAQAAFKELGLSAKNVEKGMQVDAMGTMLNLLERLGKAKDSVKLANAIGGGEWFDEILRMKDALGEIKRLRDALATGKAKGSLDNALSIDMDTTVKKLDRVKAVIMDIMAQLAKPALPAIDSVAERLLRTVESMKKTGFLAGPDGQPIDRHREKSPVPFSPQNRARFMRRGIAAYQERVTTPRNPPPAMFAQIEGATPHLDLQKIDQARADVIAAAAKMKDALSFSATPTVNTGPAISALDALAAKARAVSGKISSMSFAPAGGVRMPANLTGGRGSSGSSGSGASSAPAATTPGKQARLNRGGFQIANLHLHGVQNPEAFHRRMVAMTDRRIRSARDGALHDIG